MDHSSPAIQYGTTFVKQKSRLIILVTNFKWNMIFLFGCSQSQLQTANTAYLKFTKRSNIIQLTLRCYERLTKFFKLALCAHVLLKTQFLARICRQIYDRNVFGPPLYTQVGSKSIIYRISAAFFASRFRSRWSWRCQYCKRTTYNDKRSSEYWLFHLLSFN